MNIIRKSIPNSWGNKSKTITKVLDKLISRKEELSNNREINTTVTVPGTIRTVVGRKVWSEILREVSMKKLTNKAILVYLLVFHTTVATLFWIHCNLCRLNLERLLKSELK